MSTDNQAGTGAAHVDFWVWIREWCKDNPDVWSYEVVLPAPLPPAGVG